MRIRKYTVISALLLLIVSLTSCMNMRTGRPGRSLSENSANEGITVSNNAINTDAHILISRAGFEKDGSKRALIASPVEEKGFSVIDCDTDETVFEGRVKYRGGYKEEEEKPGIIDLTEYNREGNYYIRTESGAFSEEFSVGQDIYRDVLAKRISRFGEKDTSDIKISGQNINSVYLRIADRLLTQEFFPGSIDKKTADDPMIIPRTLLLARTDIESLKDCVDKNGELKTSFNNNMGTCYGYSAVMAMYSYLYQKYDSKGAREYIDLAALVYANTEKKYEDSSSVGKKNADDKRYWAAAQLYKLTGRNEYKQVLETYADNPPKGFREDASGYLGTIAYLTCYNRIDLDAAEKMIKALMTDINDVVRESSAEDYFVLIKDTDEEKSFQTLYENARLVVLGNYISKNIKYVETGENHIAFLYGRNALGKDYAFDEGSDMYEEPMEYILAGLIDTYIYEDREPKAMGR